MKPVSHTEQSAPLKTPAQIRRMAVAGRIVADVLESCVEACIPGMTTAQIDQIARLACQEAGGTSLFENYPDYKPRSGFPAVICISINEEIVHGIPGPRVIQEGDVVSIDFGVRKGGWCADAARTIVVGRGRAEHLRLVTQTREVLEHAIARMEPGLYWSEVAADMQRLAEEAGFGVVREYVGHGIGRRLHEPPRVPGFVSRQLLQNDFVLRPGMVLAVEPMLTTRSGDTRVLADGWTVVTADGGFAAHEEETVALTDDGPVVLTRQG